MSRLAIPSRWGVRLGQLHGIEWKHDDDATGTYRRTFGNTCELGEWLLDRYGCRFAKRVKAVELTTEGYAEI